MNILAARAVVHYKRRAFCTKLLHVVILRTSLDFLSRSFPLSALHNSLPLPPSLSSLLCQSSPPPAGFRARNKNGNACHLLPWGKLIKFYSSFSLFQGGGSRFKKASSDKLKTRDSKHYALRHTLRDVYLTFLMKNVSLGRCISPYLRSENRFQLCFVAKFSLFLLFIPRSDSKDLRKMYSRIYPNNMCLLMYGHKRLGSWL